MKIFFFCFAENIFWAVDLEFFFFFYFYYLWFSLFIVPQISWMLCVLHFLDLTFSLTHVSISNILYLMTMISSSISCILLVELVSVFLFPYLHVPFWEFPHFVFSLLLLISIFRSWTALLPSTVWFFLVLFKRLFIPSNFPFVLSSISLKGIYSLPL